MQTFLSLGFLREKISELQHALFFNSSDSLLKFPVHVVNAICTDELGQIWFSVPRPSQYLHEFDREFPASLDFFKKGKLFYLKVLGKAFIVTDPEELNMLAGIPLETIESARAGEVILVKVKMQFADYFENAPIPEPRHIFKLNSQLYKWFFQHQDNFLHKRAVLHYNLG